MITEVQNRPKSLRSSIISAVFFFPDQYGDRDRENVCCEEIC